MEQSFHDLYLPSQKCLSNWNTIAELCLPKIVDAFKFEFLWLIFKEAAQSFHDLYLLLGKITQVLKHCRKTVTIFWFYRNSVLV